MKPCVWRPAAKEDLRDELRYYRQNAGAKVAARLVELARRVEDSLARNPAIGSPALGRSLNVDALRAWRIEEFPLSVWYFERESSVEVVRVVGHRQDATDIDLE